MSNVSSDAEARENSLCPRAPASRSTDAALDKPVNGADVAPAVVYMTQDALPPFGSDDLVSSHTSNAACAKPGEGNHAVSSSVGAELPTSAPSPHPADERKPSVIAGEKLGPTLSDGASPSIASGTSVANGGKGVEDDVGEDKITEEISPEDELSTILISMGVDENLFRGPRCRQRLRGQLQAAGGDLDKAVRKFFEFQDKTQYLEQV